ncbi:MAG: site-2 protease family protein [Candidatus Niyogibacteria bacterium]|nr:site-2 protease family protein [Candidatus Niyogibacteria bacterium]
MLTFFTFFAVLAVLILAHELGHFLAAKWSGVKVEEFGLGLPPRLWGKQKRETLYSINWLPFGGFVKIEGEDATAETAVSERSFGAKGVFARALILAAGVVFNILLAFIFLTGGYVIGTPATISEGEAYSGEAHVVILDVEAGSPAEKVGMKPGDAILNLKSGTETEAVATTDGVRAFIYRHLGREVALTLKRNGDIVEIKATPRSDAPKGSGPLGIGMAKVGLKKYPIGTALVEGAKDTYFMTLMTLGSIYHFFADIFTGNGGMDKVTGPVGMVKMVGGALDFGWLYLLNFVALLSINLAVINIIPFPGLDGGRLLFLGVEAVTRRRISQKVASVAHAAGFFFLLFLMLAITYNDIIKLAG